MARPAIGIEMLPYFFQVQVNHDQRLAILENTLAECPNLETVREQLKLNHVE